jgi:hypothetical protein
MKADEETSSKATPDANDQDALGEDVKVTEKADTRNASKKNVFIALILLIALVVLFGSK